MDTPKGWFKTSEVLPTTEVGGQVDVIIRNPVWATALRGMYTHWPDDPMYERWSIYDQKKDKYYLLGNVGEGFEPTYWTHFPDPWANES